MRLRVRRNWKPLQCIVYLALRGLLFCGMPSAAQTDIETPQQILLEDLNQARVQQGRPALAYDPKLTAAAQRHADMMASTGMLTHDLPGEPGLAERCGAAGAHFSAIAENIASGGALHSIHDSWMHSPDHYENLMSPLYTAVGIGVAKSGHTLYAVEDFGRTVQAQTPDDVEQRVRDMLAIRDVDPSADPRAARKLCASGRRSYDGPPPIPGLVIQFASPDLDKLGPVLDQRIKPGMYKSASVGACSVSDANGFTKFKLALLLY